MFVSLLKEVFSQPLIEPTIQPRPPICLREPSTQSFRNCLGVT